MTSGYLSRRLERLEDPAGHDLPPGPTVCTTVNPGESLDDAILREHGPDGLPECGLHLVVRLFDPPQRDADGRIIPPSEPLDE